MKNVIYIVAFILTFANCFAEELDNCKIQGFERAAWTKPDSIPNTVETNEDLNQIVILHPNPTGGSFILTSAAIEFFSGSISITDLLGEIVIDNIKFDVINPGAIEISDDRFKIAPTGIYILRLNSTEQRLHLKLIKFE
ncbi:MAG: T9SS type A sorting domain-containing protein [Desulfobulbaceae bacterium]|nr:T9SS type A sorting domain-containing protein [Desulfobulbaceae bacterium]